MRLENNFKLPLSNLPDKISDSKNISQLFTKLITIEIILEHVERIKQHLKRNELSPASLRPEHGEPCDQTIVTIHDLGDLAIVIIKEVIPHQLLVNLGNMKILEDIKCSLSRYLQITPVNRFGQHFILSWTFVTKL